MLMRSFINSLFNLRLQEEQQAVKSADTVAKLNYDTTEFPKRRFPISLWVIGVVWSYVKQQI